MKPVVLIAETNEELRDDFRRFLARRGFHVETVADGLECLGELRRAAPDVLILDQELLWGGGDGVLAWLRDGSVRVPVILTTTGCLPDKTISAPGPPVLKCLTKPFTLKTLLDTVNAAVAPKAATEPFIRNREPVLTESFAG